MIDVRPWMRRFLGVKPETLTVVVKAIDADGRPLEGIRVDVRIVVDDETFHMRDMTPGGWNG